MTPLPPLRPSWGVWGAHAAGWSRGDRLASKLCGRGESRFARPLAMVMPAPQLGVQLLIARTRKQRRAEGLLLTASVRLRRAPRCRQRHDPLRVAAAIAAADRHRCLGRATRSGLGNTSTLCVALQAHLPIQYQQPSLIRRPLRFGRRRRTGTIGSRRDRLLLLWPDRCSLDTPLLPRRIRTGRL